MILPVAVARGVAAGEITGVTRLEEVSDDDARAAGETGADAVRASFRLEVGYRISPRGAAYPDATT